MLCNPGRIKVFDDLFPGLIVFPAISLRYLHSCYYYWLVPFHPAEPEETVIRKIFFVKGAPSRKGRPYS